MVAINTSLTEDQPGVLQVSPALLAQRLRRPPREWQTRGSNPALALEILPGRVTPVTWKSSLQWLPWLALYRCRVSAETGWSGVCILWLGEIDRLICNFRSVPGTHKHDAGTLSKQQTNFPVTSLPHANWRKEVGFPLRQMKQQAAVAADEAAGAAALPQPITTTPSRFHDNGNDDCSDQSRPLTRDRKMQI